MRKDSAVAPIIKFAGHCGSVDDIHSQIRSLHFQTERAPPSTLQIAARISLTLAGLGLVASSAAFPSARVTGLLWSCP